MSLKSSLFIAGLCTVLLGGLPLWADDAPAPGETCADRPAFTISSAGDDSYELSVITNGEERPYILAVNYASNVPICSTTIDKDCKTVSGRQGAKPPQVFVSPTAPCFGPNPPAEAKLTQAILTAINDNVRVNNLPVPASFCAVASKDGTPVTLFLDRQALLDSQGRVTITYTAKKESTTVACQKNDTGIATVKALQKNRLNIDVGPVFNLAGDGSYDAKTEAALTARSEWHKCFVGGFALRYSALEATKSNSSTDDQAGSSGSNAAKADADPQDDGKKEFDPFTQKGGVFEVNLFGVYRPRSPAFGLAGGVGFATVPGKEKSDTLDARKRWWIAAETAVQGYNAGQPADSLANASGYVRAGYMDDAVWDKTVIKQASAAGVTPATPAVTSDESARYFVEGEIELPKLGTASTRFALRLFASLPQSGKGAADVRISALVTIDPRGWFPTLSGKLPKAGT